MSAQLKSAEYYDQLLHDWERKWNPEYRADAEPATRQVTREAIEHKRPSREAAKQSKQAFSTWNNSRRDHIVCTSESGHDYKLVSWKSPNGSDMERCGNCGHRRTAK